MRCRPGKGRSAPSRAPPVSPWLLGFKKADRVLNKVALKSQTRRSCGDV